MTDIDLTAAIEAAQDEMNDWETFRAGDGHLSIGMKERERTPAEVVARIAPLIEAAVREQVAQELRDQAGEWTRTDVVRALPDIADSVIADGPLLAAQLISPPPDSVCDDRVVAELAARWLKAKNGSAFPDRSLIYKAECALVAAVNTWKVRFIIRGIASLPNRCG